MCPMEALYLGSLTDLKGFGFVMASRNLPPAVTRQLDCLLRSYSQLTYAPVSFPFVRPRWICPQSRYRGPLVLCTQSVVGPLQ